MAETKELNPIFVSCFALYVVNMDKLSKVIDKKEKRQTKKYFENQTKKKYFKNKKANNRHIDMQKGNRNKVCLIHDQTWTGSVLYYVSKK